MRVGVADEALLVPESDRDEGVCALCMDVVVGIEVVVELLVGVVGMLVVDGMRAVVGAVVTPAGGPKERFGGPN